MLKDKIIKFLSFLKTISFSLTLKSILIATFIFLVIFISSIISYISHRSYKLAVFDFADQYRNEINSRIGSHLENFFSIPLVIIEQNSNLISKGILDQENQDQLSRHFFDQVKIFPTVNSIYFANPEGGLANAGREAEVDSLYLIKTDNFEKGVFRKYRTDNLGTKLEEIASIAEFDARTRLWFSSAVESDISIFSDVYMLFTGHDLAITASKSVLDSNSNLIGVVAVDLFLGQINRFLNDLAIARTGMSFIIEKTGKLIATSCSEKNSFDSIFDSDSPIIEKSANILTERFNGFYDIIDSYDYRFRLKNELYYSRVTPINFNDSLDWLIVTIIPESDFLEQQKKQIIQNYLYVFLTILFSIFLAIYASKKITRPLSDLIESIHILCLGDWKEIESKSKIVEIKKLSDDFNSMGLKVKDSLNNLKAELSSHKATLEKLNESRDQIRNISDNIPGGFVYQIKKRNQEPGKFYYLSAGVKELHGYTPAQIFNKNELLYEQIHEEDMDKFLKAEATAVKNMTKLDLEVRIRKQDGTIHWRKIVSMPRKVNDETIFDGLVLDITENKLMIQRIKEEKERLSVTLSSIGDGVITTDTDGRIIDINKEAQKITGWEQDQACGKPLGEIFNLVIEDSEKPYPNPVEIVLKTKKITELESRCKLISRSGKKIRIDDSAAPIKDPEGKIIGVVLVFRDITEKEKIKEKMHRADKIESLGLLAGGIAHDFNNLLNAVFGYIDIAKTSLAERDFLECQKFLDKSLSAFEKTKALTHQLLTFSKGGEPVRKMGNINSVVEDSISLVLAGTNLKVNFSRNDNISACSFDPNQISQVINNLLLNAKEAMPSGGLIEVRTVNYQHIQGDNLKPKGKYVKIIISDNGCGIPKDLQKKIFDPFFTTKSEGNGLGLSTSFSIIEKHQGFIEVYSELNKGTQVTVFLPAADDEIMPEKKNDSSRHQGSGYVLIMDDEDYILDIAGEMLKGMGYEPVFTENGETLLKKLNEFLENDIDITAIILDLTIPGAMGGKETIIEVRKILPDLPVFASSGYSSDDIIANPQNYGFTGSIAKPYSYKDMTELFKKHF